MKRILLIISSLVLVSCAASTVVIPDISSVDEATAKTLLSQKTLIPSIEYEFSDSIYKG
jgi:beta-lactam-binding protein with PASTA domain